MTHIDQVVEPQVHPHVRSNRRPPTMAAEKRFFDKLTTTGGTATATAGITNGQEPVKMSAAR